jgi:hypothetical protein
MATDLLLAIVVMSLVLTTLTEKETLQVEIVVMVVDEDGAEVPSIVSVAHPAVATVQARHNLAEEMGRNGLATMRVLQEEI